MRSALTALLVLCLLLAGIQRAASGDNQPTDTPATTPALPDADPVLEYVWLSTGDGFSDTKLTDLAADWNLRVDAGGYEIITANILMPQFPTDDFDLVWVLLWSSQTARDAGWDHWNAHQAEDWQASVAGVLQSPPTGVYSFSPHWGYTSPAFKLKAGDSFFSQFHFCGWRDGNDASQQAAFQVRYNEWASNGEPSGTYGYLTLEPHSALPSIDLVWLDIFGSDATRQAGAARWQDSELQSVWNTMVSCDSYSFSSTKIRS